MSNNAHVGELIKGWLKRQSALDEKADNARELGLDYEPSIIDMAREAGGMVNVLLHGRHDNTVFTTGELKAFADLIRADERKKFLGALRQLHDSYSLQSDPSGLRIMGETAHGIKENT